MTKQDVLNARQALDEAAMRAGSVKAQAAQRLQLKADCAATSGHVFAESDSECVFCQADKDAAKKQLSANVVKG